MYYAGTEEEWNNITDDGDNGRLFNATIHFNHVHSYDCSSDVIAPTCASQGYTVHECVCGDFTVDSFVGPHNTELENDETATCTENGYTGDYVCKDCGKTVTKGAVMPATDHDYGAWKSNGDGMHSRICGNDSSHVETYKCSGGTATCTDKAVCEVCGTPYGEVDGTNHDFTAQVKNADTLVSAATCQDKAVYYFSCSRCGEIDTHTFKGDLDPNAHTGEKEWSTKNETQHKQTWKCCGAVVVDLENHEWKDGVREECGYVCLHTGGEADCTHKAKCEVCGEEYGEVDSDNHDLENIKGNAATVTEKGNTEYWHCKDCDGSFSDKDGKNEIDLKDTVIGKLPPEIIDGKGQSITVGEKKELTFRSNGAFADFIRVEVDGKTVDGKNYTVKEGSTLVTLKADYVATLSVGEHTLGIESESGTAETTFTVNAKVVDTNSPQTGDNSHMVLWIALLLVSGGAFVSMVALSKKKKYSAK